ncbi:MAG: leucine-rich repeat protein [Abditibacteriota bacterium]|nr:leucine-rich repeat protein [Abditibacteriota bacterium]
MAVLRCPNCHHQIAYNAKRCYHCGLEYTSTMHFIALDNMSKEIAEERAQALEFRKENPFIIDEEGILKKYIGLDKDVKIPDGVTQIGEYAFEECSINTVIIPDSVTAIDRCAFKNCKSLTKVTIPKSVTAIGFWAFENCKSLTKVTIPCRENEIDHHAFVGCYHLTELTIHGNKIDLEKNDPFRISELDTLSLFLFCLFFGFLGVHKFVEGKTGMGILYACTAGLFYIGWLADLVGYIVLLSKGVKWVIPK